MLERLILTHATTNTQHEKGKQTGFLQVFCFCKIGIEFLLNGVYVVEIVTI